MDFEVQKSVGLANQKEPGTNGDTIKAEEELDAST